MKKLTKDDEEKIVHVLEKVAAAVATGTAPNEAIVKAALDEQIPPGHIRLVINAYNNGRTTKQRRSSDDPLEKAAEFELADPVAIMEKLYPSHVKAASLLHTETVVSSDYDLPPTWAGRNRRASSSVLEKVAAAICHDVEEPFKRDPNRFDKRASGLIQKLNRQRENVYVEAENLFDKVSHCYGALCSYFKYASAIPFDEARDNAEAFFGPAAVVLFTKLSEDLTPPSVKLIRKYVPEEKKKKKTIRVRMNREASPYKEVEACIKSAQAYGEIKKNILDFEKKAFAAQLDLERAIAGLEATPLPADPNLSILNRLGGEKRAFNKAAIGLMGGSALQSGAEFTFGSAAAKSVLDELGADSKDKLKNKAYASLTDPTHEATLRSIRTQAALHGLLNSPYFEGEDPYQVTDLFNKVTTMAPRLTEQPLALESVLRRYMAQGQTDTHDLDSLMGLEVKMKQRDEPRKQTNFTDMVTGTKSRRDDE